MKTTDYLRYKNLEQYLFTDVNRRFKREKSIGDWHSTSSQTISISKEQ